MNAMGRRGGHARRTIRLTTRGRRALVAVGVVALLAAGLALTGAFTDRSLVAHPVDACASPPPMRTYRGVTLQPEAMSGYLQAQRFAGRSIPVVESYRSCHKQALACVSICGNADGCSGRCAKPGTSYHQLGAAIDIPQSALDTPAIVSALRRTGWCQALPDSDPGHFSFDGCH
jgi:hypothetical protein